MALDLFNRKQREQDLGERLPPGQRLTDGWPVLHYGSIPRFDEQAWRFHIVGDDFVEEPVSLTWAEFQALPRTDVTCDIHCVTRWSKFDMTFRGVHWRELAQRCRPAASARFVIAHAEHGFTANIPLASLEQEGALLAYEANGEPLTPEHGSPLRLVIPGRYFWKSAKWLRGLELRHDDVPGFWERYGYHNDADPWREERYAF